MINHVVLFKLKEFSAHERISAAHEIKELLESLKNEIPELVHIEAGINYELPSKSYDIALISHFKSVSDLDRYRVHPAHVKVAERIGQLVEARSAVDYEF